MKTSKRLFALLLTACMVLAMIPAVSATGEVATKTVTYDFDYMGVCNANGLKYISNSLTNEDALHNMNCYYEGSGTTIAGATIDQKYFNWKYKESDVTSTRGFGSGYFWTKSTEGKYAAFIIDSPGAGNWTISVNHLVSNYGASQVDIYILPFTETIDADNLGSSIGSYNCDDPQSTVADKPTVYKDSPNAATWVNAEAKTKYILMLKATTKATSTNYARIYLSSLTMTQTYSDSNKAAAAIGESSINTDVKLQGEINANSATVAINRGVTVDLNGQTLSANTVSSVKGGELLDTSEEAAGVLKVANSDSLALASTNSQLPLYDSSKGGYRFFAYSVTSQDVTDYSTDNDSAKYWFKIAFENDAAYDLIINNDDTGFKISGRLGYKDATGTSKNKYATLENRDVYTGWAALAKDNDKVSINLTVIGISDNENYKDFNLIPRVEANGVFALGSAMTYTAA